MAEQIKFTEEEIGQINQLRQDATNVFLQLGQLTLERKKRLEELDTLESQLLQNQNQAMQNGHRAIDQRTTLARALHHGHEAIMGASRRRRDSSLSCRSSAGDGAWVSRH